MLVQIFEKQTESRLVCRKSLQKHRFKNIACNPICLNGTPGRQNNIQTTTFRRCLGLRGTNFFGLQKTSKLISNIWCTSETQQAITHSCWRHVTSRGVMWRSSWPSWREEIAELDKNIYSEIFEDKCWTLKTNHHIWKLMGVLRRTLIWKHH